MVAPEAIRRHTGFQSCRFSTVMLILILKIRTETLHLFTKLIYFKIIHEHVLLSKGGGYFKPNCTAFCNILKLTKVHTGFSMGETCAESVTCSIIVLWDTINAVMMVRVKALAR